MSTGTLQLTPRVTLPWGEGVTDDVREVGPPEGGSFVVTPGPRRRPSHSCLEPSASPGGRIAARVLNGAREPEARVLLAGDGAPRLVTPASAPLGVAARDDGGFWALHSGQVVQHDADGGAVRSIPAHAVAVVAGPGDAVWAVTLDQALLVDAQGRETGRFPWRAGPASGPATGGGLAAIATGSGGAIRVLHPDGTTTEEPPPGPPLESYERLLAGGREAVVTAVGGGIRRRAGGGLEEVPLQAAGLAGDGLPWISGRADGSVVELRLDEDLRRYDVGAGAPAQGALRVVAVERDVVTVLGPADAWQIAGGSGGRHLTVDEASYRDVLFPVAWELTSTAGTPYGAVLVAASGPSGVAVLELSWA